MLVFLWDHNIFIIRDQTIWLLGTNLGKDKILLSVNKC